MHFQAVLPAKARPSPSTHRSRSSLWMHRPPTDLPLEISEAPSSRVRSTNKRLPGGHDRLEGVGGPRFHSPGDRRGAAGAMSRLTTPLGLLRWPSFRVD